MSSSLTRHSGEAPCPAGGSTRVALQKASLLLESEYFPKGCSALRSPLRGECCRQLWAEFQERKLLVLSMVTDERVKRSLGQALKSCNRLFDGACRPCDERAFGEAKAGWVRKVSSPVSLPHASWSKDPVGELVQVVRGLLGPDWASGWREWDGLDDQKGCFEAPRKVGGTLSVPDVPFSPTTDGGGRQALRVECCKTKGKCRVVTSQRACVKRNLRPAHEALYDFLSRRGWLVRGDYEEKHARWLQDDLRPGESFVSADFSDATGNLIPEVSFAVAKVIAESPSLPAGVRADLLESFTPGALDAWCRGSGGMGAYRGPILRGQMMGNFFSFPILCLVNKASHTITRRLCKTGPRRVLINGDDTAFCGDAGFFWTWTRVVETWGMVVNKEKTGVSGSFIELNSKSWCVDSQTFVKKPVLSFLKPESEESCLLSEIVRSLKGCRPATVMAAIAYCRDSIARRGVTPSGYPTFLHKCLLPRRWYRQALIRRPQFELCRGSGPERALPVVQQGVRPPDDWLAVFDEGVKVGVRALSSVFKGRECPAFKRQMVRWKPSSPGRVRFRLTRRRWVFRWPRGLWEFWTQSGLPLVPCRGTWEVDHPSLASVVDVVTFASVPPPLAVLRDSVRPDRVNFV